MTIISIEFSKEIKLRRIRNMSTHELAFWLINSFSKDRYYASNDVIREACDEIVTRLPTTGLRLVDKLWAMKGI